MENIENNLDKPWFWNFVIANPNFTLEIVKNNPDKPWEQLYILNNSKITIKDVENNLDMNWDWYNVAFRDEVSIDFLSKILHKIDYIDYFIVINKTNFEIDIKKYIREKSKIILLTKILSQKNNQKNKKRKYDDL